jgi:hypothetical protein
MADTMRKNTDAGTRGGAACSSDEELTPISGRSGAKCARKCLEKGCKCKKIDCDYENIAQFG